MSLSVVLHGQPEFYTNLDTISGRVVLTLTRPESVGAIYVKLEGDSRTCLPVTTGNGDASPSISPLSPLRPTSQFLYRYSPLSPLLDPFAAFQDLHHSQGSNSAVEDHKVLYQVLQLFPDQSSSSSRIGGLVGGDTWLLQPGHYDYPFHFKLPLNNECGNRREMARTGGLVGIGGLGAAGQALLGRGALRRMDGSRQLMYRHVTQTLPPSMTGSVQAEIRYYVKATVQRPSLLRENWRHNIGFKFMPIEPPLPSPNMPVQEAFCCRPFAFSADDTPSRSRAGKLSTFFSNVSSTRPQAPSRSLSSSSSFLSSVPPSVMISARLPEPPVLTCNRPLPLRIVVEKLAPSPGSLRLISLQIDLVGTTHITSHGMATSESQRWIIVSNMRLSLPLTAGPDSPVGAQLDLPPSAWASVPLPNLVTPSFTTCNISRTYALELTFGVTWDRPGVSLADRGTNLVLPLVFHRVLVYSGIPPPTGLAAAADSHKDDRAPPLPPRVSSSAPATPTSPAPPHHPPQYAEPPPSYDEAMAQTVGSPFDGTGLSRPAFSGVTNENSPSQIPEKG